MKHFVRGERVGVGEVSLADKDAEIPRLRKLESAGPNPRIPRLVRGHSAAHAAGLQRAHTGRGRAADGRGSAADRPRIGLPIGEWYMEKSILRNSRLIG